MTRLYNHTRYPDQALKDVLNFAAQVAGVKGDVPVKVTRARSLQPGALAHQSFPYLKTLKGKPTTSIDRRILKCPVGWVSISLPDLDCNRFASMRLYAGYIAARWFVNVAIHEMAHIRQYRTGQFREKREADGASFGGKLPGKRRKMSHDRRPCEIDAENTVDAVRQDAARNRRRLELIGELAYVLTGGKS
jgi:hypothetical protein